MDNNILFFKWLVIALAVFVNLLTLVSWFDIAFYDLPATMSGWVPILANTAVGIVLIKISLLDWRW
ncbi:MAG TPA: hypothetical protein EYO74_00725 [Piscirickettsiaceae bacterium]|jgi:hypothetical protein|uniref:Uncharacterized protein n=1 Tax=hydrothermal vent metagenome TaxID=652676 RepID=A0A1W1DC00_9ZZZZ|nr:hypothetical protein [Piscirickettsiaceae bacterium]